MPKAARLGPAVRRAHAGSPAAGLLLVAAVVLVAIAADGGGFAVTTWCPLALFVGGLLAVGLAAVPQATPPLVRGAVAALTLYALWSYLTIAWAHQKADAWDGANRTLLYAAVFALFALWRLRSLAAATVLGTLVAGMALLALIELLRAAGAANPAGFFFEGRFSSPATYQNANVALWTLGLWPAVILASRRELPVWARAALAAAAVVLGASALLGQSRGWLFAAPVTAVIVLAITPQRVRLVLTGLLVAGTVAAISRPLLDVYDASGGPGFAAAVADAVRAIIFAAAFAAIVVGVAAWVEARRPRPSRRTERRAGHLLFATGAVAVVVVAVLFVSTVGSPFTAVADGWNTFKTQPHATGAGSRFSQSLGSYRYDFWRVAWNEFKSHPVAGIGADNFQQAYLLHRRGDQNPRYPHSVELRALSQTGLVGTVLLLVALGAATLAAALAIRRRRGIGAAVAAGGLATFAYFVIHGTVDWFWEFPALGVFAFAALGLAAGLLPRRAVRARPLIRGRALTAAAVVCALAVVFSLGAPWLSARWTNDALASWPRAPRAAFDNLQRAADAKPGDPLPYLYAGSIALQLGRLSDAQAYFGRALGRDARSQYAEFELGLIDAQRKRTASATAHLRRAIALNPLDAVARDTLHRVRARQPVNIARVNAQLAAESQDVIK